MYRCGGYRSPRGHCGADDCEDCYPGCSLPCDDCEKPRHDCECDDEDAYTLPKKAQRTNSGQRP